MDPDISKLATSFSNLQISIQNCNSLNMSYSSSQNQRLKIEAISNLKSDVILLCDLRLGNKNLTSSKADISNLFLINNNCSYDLIVNSSQTKRGVGILLKKDLNIKILATENDEDENYLLIKTEIKGSVCTFGAIYGPNEHNPAFFRNLYAACSR
jgi:hypothetical protein